MHARALPQVLSFALSLLAAACGSSDGGGSGGSGGIEAPRILDEPIDERRTIGERTFELFVPSGIDLSQPTALVLSHHGATPGTGGASHLQKGVAGTNAHAQEHGYIAVHPQSRTRGTEEDPVQSWESTADSPDLRYIDELLDALRAEFTIDEARIFATGISSGGAFSYALACWRADVIAAIGPVAGVDPTENCDTSRRVPAVAFYGTNDGSYDRGSQSAMDWAQDNGCSAQTEEVFQNGDSTCDAWTGCDADVELCVVDGGGHTWPGSATGPIFEAAGQGKTTLDLDATDHMWRFFTEHPKTN
jgi:polyhydroxybutyrate depolymerase